MDTAERFGEQICTEEIFKKKFLSANYQLKFIMNT